jgi:hypothetical protein
MTWQLDDRREGESTGQLIPGLAHPESSGIHST